MDPAAWNALCTTVRVLNVIVGVLARQIGVWRHVLGAAIDHGGCWWVAAAEIMRLRSCNVTLADMPGIEQATLEWSTPPHHAARLSLVQIEHARGLIETAYRLSAGQLDQAMRQLWAAHIPPTPAPAPTPAAPSRQPQMVQVQATQRPAEERTRKNVPWSYESPSAEERADERAREEQAQERLRQMREEAKAKSRDPVPRPRPRPAKTPATSRPPPKPKPSTADADLEWALQLRAKEDIKPVVDDYLAMHACLLHALVTRDVRKLADAPAHMTSAYENARVFWRNNLDVGKPVEECAAAFRRQRERLRTAAWPAAAGTGRVPVRIVVSMCSTPHEPLAPIPDDEMHAAFNGVRWASASWSEWLHGMMKQDRDLVGAAQRNASRYGSASGTTNFNIYMMYMCRAVASVLAHMREGDDLVLLPYGKRHLSCAVDWVKIGDHIAKMGLRRPSVANYPAERNDHPEALWMLLSLYAHQPEDVRMPVVFVDAMDVCTAERLDDARRLFALPGTAVVLAEGWDIDVDGRPLAPMGGTQMPPPTAPEDGPPARVAVVHGNALRMFNLDTGLPFDLHAQTSYGCLTLAAAAVDPYLFVQTYLRNDLHIGNAHPMLTLEFTLRRMALERGAAVTPAFAFRTDWCDSWWRSTEALYGCALNIQACATTARHLCVRVAPPVHGLAQAAWIERMGILDPGVVDQGGLGGADVGYQYAREPEWMGLINGEHDRLQSLWTLHALLHMSISKSYADSTDASVAREMRDECGRDIAKYVAVSGFRVDRLHAVVGEYAEYARARAAAAHKRNAARLAAQNHSDRKDMAETMRLLTAFRVLCSDMTIAMVEDAPEWARHLVTAFANSLESDVERSGATRSLSATEYGPQQPT